VPWVLAKLVAKTRRAFVFVFAAPLALACSAQQTPDRPLTSDEAALLDNVAYLRYMADKCPLSRQSAEALGLMGMGIGSSMPHVDRAVAQSILSKAEGRAGDDIAISKDESCGRAQRSLDSLVQGLMNRNSTDKK
jgi:hypothetical protein